MKTGRLTTTLVTLQDKDKMTWQINPDKTERDRVDRKTDIDKAERERHGGQED